MEVLIATGKELERRGHSVDVVSLDAPNSAWLKDFPLKIYPLGPATKRYAYTANLGPWLDTNLSNYSLVVLHGLWNYSSVGSWLRLRKAEIPYLIFAHGMLDPWFRAAYPIKHLWKQLYWTALEGRVLSGAAAVLFTAEDERRLARGSFRGHKYRERVVPLGISDLNSPAEEQILAFRSSFPHLSSRRYVLFLSRIHPKKGLDLLLFAFARLSMDFPDIDLVIAGPDQVGWKAQLERQSEELGITDRIHWVGMLSGATKFGAFRCAEAFVLPSHQENFGIVIAEAMACGVPVLITNKINIWREVAETGGGLVSNDIESDIFEMLKKYLNMNHSERERMRFLARSGFSECFNVEITAVNLIDVCNAAIRNDVGQTSQL
ncbi:glycosyltransferase [Bradyrhizobium sp. CCBAU 11430]|uniref:glycosyltransferase n=1 Tax=Bradyrhizobium sp. CCBAU 11430 TaxID=1630881 RepID=UPI002306294F|nr:glycosyltransferase [Bradyrhizobium sp. CCBAU 11430]